MSTVHDVETAIRDFSPDELARFRAWLLAYDVEAWDRQLEEDVRQGRLDAQAEVALREIHARQIARP